MASETTSMMSVRVPSDVKDEATAVLDELGLTMSCAMNLYLRAIIRKQGIPFDLSISDQPCDQCPVKQVEPEVVTETRAGA